MRQPKIHPLVYEVNARAWLAELSRVHGFSVTLDSVPSQVFRDWRELGFTHIWLMGVWKTGPLTRASAVSNWKRFWLKEDPAAPVSEDGIVSSPYAISGYEVEETLGGRNGLAMFRQQLKAHGLGLVLDFIPNHVGLDHPWLLQNPELFVQSESFRDGTFRRRARGRWHHFAHGKDPYFPPWSDTAQLDYRQARTRELMRTELLAIAGMCDGVRCDMAMLVLNEVFERNWIHFPSNGTPPTEEFWSEAIRSVRQKRPDFMFLAEAYWGLEARLLELGFDYAYNKTVYDLLVSRRADAVHEYLSRQGAAFLHGAAHFLENHDEARAAHVFREEEHRASALLILSMPGLRILHHGQLSGARLRAKVQYRQFPEEQENPALARFYRETLQLLEGTVVGRGDAHLLQPESADDGSQNFRNVSATLWRGDGIDDLVLVNLGPSPAKCAIHLRFEFEGTNRVMLRDLLGQDRFENTRGELERGLQFHLRPHATHLFRIEPLPEQRP